MIKRNDGGMAAGLRPIGGKPSLNDVGRLGDPGECGLECGRILPRRIARAAIAPREFGQPATARRVARAGLGYDPVNHLRVARRADRQPVLEIPG